MIYVNLLLITFIYMYIIDKSGITIELSKKIFQLMKKEWKGQILGKPFNCSSCMIFHTVWIYLIVFNSFNILVALTLAIIYSTIINLIINKIWEKIIKTLWSIN
jgi:hypothetical protein